MQLMIEVSACVTLNILIVLTLYTILYYYSTIILYTPHISHIIIYYNRILYNII